MPNEFAPKALLRNENTVISVREIMRSRLFTLSPENLSAAFLSSHRPWILFRPGSRVVVRLSAYVHVFMFCVQNSNSGNSNNNTLAWRASRKALTRTEGASALVPEYRSRCLAICVLHCRPQQYLISCSDVCAVVPLVFLSLPFPSPVLRSGAKS